MSLDKILSKLVYVLLVSLFLYEFSMGLAVAHVTPFANCCDDALLNVAAAPSIETEDRQVNLR